MTPVSKPTISLRGAFVCFFRNHAVTPDYQRLVWTCHRCHAEGPKLWMTGAWFLDWLRGRKPWTYWRWRY